MVDAPTGRRSVPSRIRFLIRATAIPGGSIPECSKNVLSSAEMKASITRRGMAETGTKTRFSVANSASSLPSPAWMRLTMGGS